MVITTSSVDVILYAKWIANPTYTVTYYSPFCNSGSAPIDSTNYEQGQPVTVLGNTGNLVEVGNPFADWVTRSQSLLSSTSLKHQLVIRL